METFRAKVSVAPKHFPILVTRNQCDLWDLKSCFEQPARSLMAEVVEVQIDDAEILARPRESCAGRTVIEGKDAGVSVVT